MASGWTSERRARQREGSGDGDRGSAPPGRERLKARRGRPQNAYHDGQRPRWRELMTALSAGMRAQ
jgi:hypothetical protein